MHLYADQYKTSKTWEMILSLTRYICMRRITHLHAYATEKRYEYWIGYTNYIACELLHYAAVKHLANLILIKVYRNILIQGSKFTASCKNPKGNLFVEFSSIEILWCTYCTCICTIWWKYMYELVKAHKSGSLNICKNGTFSLSSH